MQYGRSKFASYNTMLYLRLLLMPITRRRCSGICILQGAVVGVHWSFDLASSADLKHGILDVCASRLYPNKLHCHGAGLTGLGRSLPARRARQPVAVRASLYGAEEPLRQAAQALASSTCASRKPCTMPCFPSVCCISTLELRLAL